MRRCVVVQFNQRIPQKSTVSVVCFNFIDEIWGGLGGGGGGGVLCIESYFPFDLRFNPLFDMFF